MRLAKLEDSRRNDTDICSLISVMANLSGVMIWTFLPSNVSGRTKKTVVSTLLFFCYCGGNAGGAQIFNSKDAPYYKPAIVTCAALLATQIVLFISWRTYCENHIAAQNYPQCD